MTNKIYPKGIEKLCEGMRIEKNGDGFNTCPVTFYLGLENCLLNHPNSKTDITRKEECPLYLYLNHKTKYQN